MKRSLVLHSVDMRSYVVCLCPHHGSSVHGIVLSFQTLVEVLTQDQVVSAHQGVVDILSSKFKGFYRLIILFLQIIFTNKPLEPSLTNFC